MTSSWPAGETLTVVGKGRVGSTVSAALTRRGFSFIGPTGRGDTVTTTVALLCVPDGAIGPLAATLGPEIAVGHCSGATGLAVLGHGDSFSVHPLTTVVGGVDDLVGMPAAIDSTSPRAAAVVGGLVDLLELRPFEVADEDRVAYHAAASFAANFLVTVESAAATLLSTAHVDRAMLVPMVRQAIDQWAEKGSAALVGPIMRGDVDVVERQTRAVATRTPELLPLWEALAEATRELAASTAREV